MDRHGLMMAGMAQDHPIFTESIRRIRELLGDTGLQPLEQEVLERLVHSSGDPSIAELLRFSEGACEAGLSALRAGAVILTDTEMAAAALEVLLKQVEAGAPRPSLVIGMPVGFVGVSESKRHLAQSDLAQIRLEGTRGGAGLVAAAVNALLRAAAGSDQSPAS